MNVSSNDAVYDAVDKSHNVLMNVCVCAHLNTQFRESNNAKIWMPECQAATPVSFISSTVQLDSVKGTYLQEIKFHLRFC